MAKKRPAPTWADVTAAGRRSFARAMIQFIWALANTTDLGAEGIERVIDYMHEQQDSFNQGYMTYKDVVKALKDELGVGIDLTEIEKIIHER